MKTAFVTALTKELYGDFKTLLVSAWQASRAFIASASLLRYESPVQVLDAAKRGEIVDGQTILLEAKPSPFGPFLRDHFVMPAVGPRLGMRRGPPIVHAHPMIALAAQAMSHYRPVGLYPPASEGVSQGCLYPSDAGTCGFIGVVNSMPGGSALSTHLPALFASRHTPYFNMPCHVKGVLRLLSEATFVDAGFPIEGYQSLRAAGEVWFLDVTGDESTCKPLGDAVTSELWGGLYASGHIEVTSSSGNVVLYRDLLDTLRSTIEATGRTTSVVSEIGLGRGHAICADGCRIFVSTALPVYAIHMDTELAIEYENSRRSFDGICSSMLNSIATLCESRSVELRNPRDLDFSYSNSATAHTVLHSDAAATIADPIAIAVRDWHRKRSLAASERG